MDVNMYIEIDFNSDEALYLQLRNQIIIGIATSQYQEGDTLPSVRQLADTIGINMHTVNKAYSVLKQEGFVKVDRRKGAVISVDIDKLQAIEELKKDLQVVDFDIDGYFVKPTTDTLVYLMNSLEEPDKQKIKEMAERTRIKEKCQ